MNKNAIFIPLMLLAIQPNKILGAANDRYQRAKEAISESGGSSSDTPLGGVYHSTNADVEHLLNEHVNYGTVDGHRFKDIIQRFYPEAKIEFGEVGRNIKAARRK